MRIGALPSVLGLGVDLAEPGSRERGIFDRLMFKMHYSKLLVKIRPSCFLKSWMQCLSKIFSSKAASAAVGYCYCYCYWFLYGCFFVVVMYRYKFNLY